MLRIDITQAEPGMQLAIPVFDPEEPGRPLLKRNYALSDAVIRRLSDKGIVTMWVRYPALSRVEKFVSLANIQAQTALVKQITEAFDSIQNDANARLDYAKYTQTLTELVDALMDQPKAALYLGDLLRSKSYLLGHSANVSYLSTLLGLKLEAYLIQQRKHLSPYRAKEVVPLGLGGMLHDIGISLLPQDAQDRFMQTGNEDDPAFREHTSLGFEYVRGDLAPASACVVLHHHQRKDGEGYTGKRFPTLGGDRIHVFARIVAVADAYDHFRNPPDGPARHGILALRHMLSADRLSAHDPPILQALVLIAPPFPPGSMAKLNNGQHVAITEHVPEFPCQPNVQTINPKDPEDESGEQIALSERRDLWIVEHDGQDVENWLFDLPPSLSPKQLAYL